MDFYFKARDEKGSLVHGLIEARDREQLIKIIFQRGYHVVHVQPGTPVRSLFTAGRRSGTREMIVYFRQLAVMQRAGITMNRSLQVLIDQTAKPVWRETILAMKRDVEKGFSLAEAASFHKAIFPPLAISMIQAGEMGGILPDALEKLSEYLESSREIRARILKVVAYPLFILVLTLLVTMTVGAMILPTFADLYTSAQVVLPLPTRMLLAFTGMASRYGGVIAVIIAGVTAGLSLWFCTAAGRLWLHRMLLHTPLAGYLVSRIVSLQLAQIAAALLAAGVPLLVTLEVAEKVMVNVAVKSILKDAREQIEEGLTVSRALQRNRCFDATLIQMVAAGEESGSLPYMFDAAALYLKREMVWALDSVMAIVEPVLILLVALVVGSVVIATLLPVFDLVNMDPTHLM